MRPPWRETPRRRAVWIGLVVAVIAAHALLGLRLAASVIGWNSAPQPRRIDVTLVRRMALAPAATVVAAAPALPAPPAPRPAPTPRAVRAAASSPAAQVAAAAQAEAAEASASHAALRARAEALAAAQAAVAEAANAAPAARAAAASAPAVASSASAPALAAAASGPVGASAEQGVAGPARPAFRWPPSTRLTFTLTGRYRDGPLLGRAEVEWRRSGTHYQVQFDIHLLPFFEQHLFSDGRIVDDGLSPRHYSESFKMPLFPARERRIEFDDDAVTLADGTRVPKPPQTQDAASQFVQFVWLFHAHPEWLAAGRIVDIPLALNNNLRRWQYEVLGPETQILTVGKVDVFHLKPLLDGPRRPNEYPIELWTSPALQYLPVRILVRADEHSYVDLLLDQLPLQAEAEDGDAADAAASAGAASAGAPATAATPASGAAAASATPTP